MSLWFNGRTLRIIIRVLNNYNMNLVFPTEVLRYSFNSPFYNPLRHERRVKANGVSRSINNSISFAQP